MYKACIQITLRPSILDPQGKAVHHAVHQLGYDSVESVRMGKYAEVSLAAESREEAEKMTRELCERVLTNPVMEDFTFTIAPVARP